MKILDFFITTIINQTRIIIFAFIIQSVWRFLSSNYSNPEDRTVIKGPIKGSPKTPCQYGTKGFKEGLQLGHNLFHNFL